MEDWKIKYAIWQDKRTPERVESLVEERFQAWCAMIRARPSPEDFAYVELSQQNLGNDCWAMLKGRALVVGSKRQLNGSLKLSTSWVG